MERDLLKLLQEGLQLEYNGIFLYRIHAREVADQALAARLAEFGAMEQEHATALGDAIVAAGGAIRYHFEPLEQLAKPLVTIIDEHLAGEKAAIALYERGLAIATDEEMRRLFQGLLRDERYHFDTLSALRGDLAGE